MSHSVLLGALLIWLPLSSEAGFAEGGIIDGKEAVPHSRPYVVFIRTTRRSNALVKCGGFLIREDFVMTAAHCWTKSNLEVRLGIHNRKKDTGQVIAVKKKIPHRDFTSHLVGNDIMLLQLSANATLGLKVRTIPLPAASDTTFPDACLVCGWGKTWCNSNLADKLQEVNVTITRSPGCPKNSICNVGERGPANGDSGGPLVCGGVACGVVSYMHYRRHEVLFVYTKISHYLSWINEQMG